MVSAQVLQSRAIAGRERHHGGSSGVGTYEAFNSHWGNHQIWGHGYGQTHFLPHPSTHMIPVALRLVPLHTQLCESREQFSLEPSMVCHFATQISEYSGGFRKTRFIYGRLRHNLMVALAGRRFGEGNPAKVYFQNWPLVDMT